MKETIPEAINEYVSRKIHKRRIELGMTQKSVAEALGVSFQQFQKYENAKNRLSAGRLYQLAEIFETKVAYFFEGYDQPSVEQSEQPQKPVDTMASARLVRQFDSITSPAIKQSVLGVIRALEPR